MDAADALPVAELLRPHSQSSSIVSRSSVMWQSIVGGISVAISLGLATAAAAGPIAWGTPVNISGAADVSQTGTFVDGIEGWNGNTTVTIGDATFHQPTVNAGTYSTPSGDIALTLGNSFQYGSFNSSSADYNTLMNENGNNGGTATLSGLTAGATYQVEFWSATVGFSATTTLDGTTTLNSGTGQFVLGTFTATGNTETFTYTGGNGDGSRVSAVQLRQLTTVAEPSTAMLASLGAVGLLAACRLRRRRA
jgi:hypothetical protein